MAEFTRCDGGCNRESPENGMHCANRWHEIAIGDPRLDHSKVVGFHKVKIFCPECWARVEQAMRSFVAAA